MEKDVTIENLLNSGVGFGPLDDDLIVLSDYSDSELIDRYNPHKQIKVSDVLFVFVKEGVLTGEINQTPIMLQKGDVLICKDARFVPAHFEKKDYKGYCFLASRRLILESVPINSLLVSAVSQFENNYIVIHLNENQKYNLSLYSDLCRSKMTPPITPTMREVLRMLIKCTLCELLEKPITDKQEVEQKVGQSEKIVMRFLNLLEQNAPRPRFIEYYASELCITAKHLSEVCKKVTGRTALQWITDYIVRDVRYYLLYTDLSVKEIVFALKFPNASFFGKYVRTHFGMSPTEFRVSGGKQLVSQSEDMAKAK